MQNALCRMKAGNAAGPRGLTADLLKFVEQVSVKRPIDVANGSWKARKRWTVGEGELVPLYGVPREVIWWAFRRKDVVEKGVKAIMEVYIGVKNRRTEDPNGLM